jgi:cohesin complex subunit SA-1/2
MTNRRTPLMDISNNDVTRIPSATASRRKSGRAIKVPEKFVPDVASTQQAPASAKRKRAGVYVENDASDSGEEEDASDGTLESAGEEEVKESRRRAKSSRKPAAKRPKVNGALSHESAQPFRPQNRSKKAKKVAIADQNADGLYGKRVHTTTTSL